MAIHTIIGLKRLAIAKQRLAPHLPPDERRRLMLSMLAAVAAVARAADLGPVLLATSEPSAPELARTLGIGLVSDGDLPWNDGLVHALGSIRPQPERVLYLAGDVPLLQTDDVRAFVAAAPAPGVAIGRARDAGTNALLVTPSAAMHPLFGMPRSSEVHAVAAQAAGLRVQVIDIAGLALDVDTIEDARDAGLLRSVSGKGRDPGGG